MEQTNRSSVVFVDRNATDSTEISPEANKNLKLLLMCLRSSHQMVDYEMFLEHFEKIKKCSQKVPYGDTNHLSQYLTMLLNTVEWPIKQKDLHRLMNIHDQLMEEKILKKSRFVVRDGFDFGLKNHYSKVAATVSSLLKNRGFSVKENTELEREKQILIKTKKQLVKARLRTKAIQSAFNSPNRSVAQSPKKRSTLPWSPNRPTQYPVGSPRILNKMYRKRVNTKPSKHSPNSLEAFFDTNQKENQPYKKNKQTRAHRIK